MPGFKAVPGFPIRDQPDLLRVHFRADHVQLDEPGRRVDLMWTVPECLFHGAVHVIRHRELTERHKHNSGFYSLCKPQPESTADVGDLIAARTAGRHTRIVVITYN